MENMLIDLLKEEQQPNLVEQPKPNLNGDPNLVEYQVKFK